MGADEPALLHLSMARSGAPACPVLTVRVQNVGSNSSRCSSKRERVEGVLVVETKMRVQKSVLVDFGFDAASVECPREPTVSQTPSNLILVGREYLTSHVSSMDAFLGNSLASNDLIVGAL